MKSFGHKTFDETIKQISMPVLELICDQCKEAKEDMKALPATQKHAVTESDGTWLTRGHHSRNHTYFFVQFFEQLFAIFYAFLYAGV